MISAGEYLDEELLLAGAELTWQRRGARSRERSRHLPRDGRERLRPPEGVRAHRRRDVAGAGTPLRRARPRPGRAARQPLLTRGPATSASPCSPPTVSTPGAAIRSSAESRSGARRRGLRRPPRSSAVPACSFRPSSPSGHETTTHCSPSAGSRRISAVIRPSTTSPRPGPPTAYAPAQSIAAQTTSGEASRAVHGAAWISSRPPTGPTWMQRPSSGRSPHEKHSEKFSPPKRTCRAAASSASAGVTAGGSTPGEAGRASATSASPSRSSMRPSSSATASGRASGGGKRSVTSAGPPTNTASRPAV